MGDVLIKARTRNSGKVVYEYRFEVASIDGKRQWKSKSGFATKREFFLLNIGKFIFLIKFINTFILFF